MSGSWVRSGTLPSDSPTSRRPLAPILENKCVSVLQGHKACQKFLRYCVGFAKFLCAGVEAAVAHQGENLCAAGGQGTVRAVGALHTTELKALRHSVESSAPSPNENPVLLRLPFIVLSAALAAPAIWFDLFFSLPLHAKNSISVRSHGWLLGLYATRPLWAPLGDSPWTGSVRHLSQAILTS